MRLAFCAAQYSYARNAYLIFFNTRSRLRGASCDKKIRIVWPSLCLVVQNGALRAACKLGSVLVASTLVWNLKR